MIGTKVKARLARLMMSDIWMCLFLPAIKTIFAVYLKDGRLPFATDCTDDEDLGKIACQGSAGHAFLAIKNEPMARRC